MQNNQQQKNRRKKLSAQQYKQLLMKKSKQGTLTQYQKKALQSMNNRPTVQQIHKKYPYLKEIDYKQQNRRTYDLKQVQQALKNAYQFAGKHNQTPEQIKQKLKDKTSEQRKMYNMLKQYTGSVAARNKLKSAAYGKLRKTMAQKLGLPLHDTDIVILLDDWTDNVKETAGHMWNQAKDFVRDNKQVVYPFLSGLLGKIHPALGAMSGLGLSTFGGSIKSQDPYAIDIEYMQHVFGSGPPQPAPRFQSHYMYQMSTVIQVPITTLGDGTSLVTIVPNCMFQSNVFAVNSNYLPFVSVANGSSSLPFAVAPLFSASPFQNQAVNTQTFGLDSLQIQFIQTQSPIQVKGKYTTSFFYQPPNNTWAASNTGNFLTNNISISDTQITNNIGYVMRKSCAQSCKLTRIGTYVLQQDKVETLPINTNATTNLQVINTQSIILIKFTGCSASTNIGTMYIKVSASIQPVALMRGILKVQPRGSYQGFFRATKQSRKMGIPLQFLNAQQASFLYQNNFACIDFKSARKQLQVEFGDGQAYVPQGYELQYNSTDSGFCGSDALNYMFVSHVRKPWMTLSQLVQTHVNIILIQNKQICYQITVDPKSFNYLCLNLDNKHAYVIRKSNKIHQYSQWIMTSNGVQYSQIKQDWIQNHTTQYQSQKLQFPISIQRLPDSFISKVIQSDIILNVSASVVKPLVQFNLSHYQDGLTICRNGYFRIDGCNLIFVNLKTSILTLLKRPLLHQVQRLAGQLVSLSGQFVSGYTLFKISNVFIDQNGLSQQQLISLVAKQLQTVQKNPGQKKSANGSSNAYDLRNLRRKPLKNLKRKYLRVVKYQNERIQFYQDAKTQTFIQIQDIQIQTAPELQKKISERTGLSIQQIRSKLKW